MMSKEQSVGFLRRALVGRLGMSLNDMPYVVPLHHIYHGNKIYFHCSCQGSKVEHFTKNPNVCYEVDEFLGIRKARNACDYGTRFRSVVAFGKVRLIVEPKRKLQILRKLMRKYADSSTYVQLNEETVEHVCVAEITIQEISGKQDIGLAPTST